jgi:flagellar motor switch protein FliM
MRPEGSFIAERLAAQHCAELTRGPRQAANPLAELGQFGERFAETLTDKLAKAFAGAAVNVSTAEPAELQANVNERRGEPVFNTTFAAGIAETGFYASLPQGAALAMVDVALGGDGKNCEVAGGRLPVSAQLMFERFEMLLTAALAEAFELPGADAVKVRKSGAAPEAALPFSGCKRTVLTVRLAIASSSHHELVLTFPGASLATLFAARGDANSGAPKGGVVAPNAEPFAGIPLPLKAILVDMAMPVSALANLAPGTVIPVAVARSVPLMVGDQVIAHGSVGSMDDRTALQLAKISLKKEN